MTDFSNLLGAYQQSGMSRGTRMQDPGYMRKLAESNSFVSGVVGGNLPAHMLREAMATSDFPTLLGDNLHSRLLGAYTEAPSTYAAWCSINRNVPDFRTQHLKYMDSRNLLGKVAEGQSGKEVPPPTEGEYTYRVETYEEKMNFSWEMLVGDDLNAFQNLPGTLGRDAKDTVEKFATGLICESTGPDSTFFTEAHGNLITDTLSVEGLRAGIKAFRAMRGPNNEPLNNRPAVLAVAPALEETAKDILSAGNLIYANQKTANSKIEGFTIENQNRYSGLELAVLDWLPNIVTSSGPDDASWFLFADPSYGRGAVEIGFLRGIGDQPLVLKKKEDAAVMGGVDAAIGSFDTRSYEYKVVHAFGGCQKDYRYAVASTGAGSA